MMKLPRRSTCPRAGREGTGRGGAEMTRWRQGDTSFSGQGRQEGYFWDVRYVAYPLKLGSGIALFGISCMSVIML